MLLATIAFSLICFGDIQESTFSSANIPRSELVARIILAKTSEGNYAKMYVNSGPNLLITELTVYNPSGCIIKTGKNITVSATYSFDIDNAVQTNIANGDFWWHALSSSDSRFDPKNGATFALVADFDDVSFTDVKNAVYKNIKIDREFLSQQILYCKTNEGRFAKIRVEAGNDLLIRSLRVFNTDGTIHLTKTNFTVPQTGTLDVDAGTVNSGISVADLWWQAATSTQFFLTPRNGSTISFESYAQFEKYLPYFKDNAFKTAMVISGSTNRNYDQWTDAEKLQLREFIYRLELNKALPITALPVLTAGRYMSTCDAIKIYLAHVAQSFWVDANNKVTWDIAGANAQYLEHLFDMRKLYSFSSANGYSFDFLVMGNVTDWNPGFSYQFLLSNSLIKPTQWETIQAVVDWCRANLRHITHYTSDWNGPFASQEDQWEYLYGYRYLPPVDKVLVPLPDRDHITHGCWGTDGLLAAVLRTVNIPVKHGRSNFGGALHSRAEFFSVGKNLRHGDDPYNGWVRLGVNNIPVDRLFLTDAQLTSLIDAPTPRPGMTVPQTASYNHGKIYVDLAIEFKTNYILDMRCHDLHSGVVTGAGSLLWNNLHDYYTDSQIASIAVSLDSALAMIPGGCDGLNYPITKQKEVSSSFAGWSVRKF
jgi:hypothetical protein